MSHKYAHEVEVGTKWTRKPYGILQDPDGWVTHTVLINRKKCFDCGRFKNDKCHTHCTDQSWAGILAACGFCSKSEARRRGFEGEAAKGYTERRVAANMILSVWRVLKG